MKVRAMTDKILLDTGRNEKEMLNYLKKFSRRRYYLRNALRGKLKGSEISLILNLLHVSLPEYVFGVEKHIKSESLHKCITDNSILSTREQYYLFMIEIELVNRINKADFLKCNYKVALLPYCLREALDDCKAIPDKLDYYCKECLPDCFINRISKILRESDIHPYIWRTIRLRTLMKQLIQKYGTVGIMGIACIVELAGGMRTCMKAGLPVIGLPLNANRCIRWMGDFYENSVDMDELRFLVS